MTREELEDLDEEVYQGMNASIYNPNKERRKIKEIAQTILDRDFDLVGLCEVGGRETLEAFNRLYLHQRYDTYLFEENSRRGIYVGALVKKGRFPGCRPQNVPVSFSRNLLKLELGPEGEGVKVFVVHLKSQLGGDRGIGQRLKEVEELSALVPQEKCIVMGDFNGVLVRGSHQFEFEPFLKLPFRDVLELVNIPPEQRRTHYHFAPEPRFNQLDYIFFSPDLPVSAGGVVEGPIPLNKAQRSYLPSDHLFLWAQVGESPSPQENRLSWFRRLWKKLYAAAVRDPNQASVRESTPSRA